MVPMLTASIRGMGRKILGVTSQMAESISRHQSTTRRMIFAQVFIFISSKASITALSLTILCLWYKNCYESGEYKMNVLFRINGATGEGNDKSQADQKKGNC